MPGSPAWFNSEFPVLRKLEGVNPAPPSEKGEQKWSTVAKSLTYNLNIPLFSSQ